MSLGALKAITHLGGDVTGRQLLPSWQGIHDPPEPPGQEFGVS